jgi:hypothetical protein
MRPRTRTLPCLDARQERFALKRSECVRAPLSSPCLEPENAVAATSAQKALGDCGKSNRRFKRGRVAFPAPARA